MLNDIVPCPYFSLLRVVNLSRSQSFAMTVQAISFALSRQPAGIGLSKTPYERAIAGTPDMLAESAAPIVPLDSKHQDRPQTSSSHSPAECEGRRGVPTTRKRTLSEAFREEVSHSQIWARNNEINLLRVQIVQCYVGTGGGRPIERDPRSSRAILDVDL